MNSLSNEFIPNSDDIEKYIQTNYPVKIFGRVFKDNKSVIDYYKSKVNEGFIIADDEFRQELIKKVDEFWATVSNHINETYKNNPDAVINGLTMEQYTDLCTQKNKMFIYETTLSQANKFNDEHKELIDILNSTELDDLNKIEKLKDLFERCKNKYKSKND